MLIKIAMTVYIFINFKKLILKEEDRISTTFYSLNLDETPPADYSKTDFMMFWVI
jgi:hypothetical protein